MPIPEKTDYDNNKHYLSKIKKTFNVINRASMIRVCEIDNSIRIHLGYPYVIKWEFLGIIFYNTIGCKISQMILKFDFKNEHAT